MFHSPSPNGAVEIWQSTKKRLPASRINWGIPPGVDMKRKVSKLSFVFCTRGPLSVFSFWGLWTRLGAVPQCQSTKNETRIWCFLTSTTKATQILGVFGVFLGGCPLLSYFFFRRRMAFWCAFPVVCQDNPSFSRVKKLDFEISKKATVPEINIASLPLKIGRNPKKERQTSSNHPFSSANMLVLRRVA